MTPTRYEQVRRVFLDARGLPPDERRGFLCAAATDDPELAREVEQLLAEGDDRSSFLDSPAVDSDLAAELLRTHEAGRGAGLHRLEAGATKISGRGADSDRDAAAQTEDFSTLPSEAVARPGTQIGPYRILRTIGEGGMGTVYEAEQRSPIVRTVALKVVKWGMDTREVIARFESERQALALMDHAHIARVLDAGATETGRPYFVMELVKGEPITKYCDVVQNPLRERLELFVQVCHAVQHAHTKGIIHRDIKSSNVLVALADGQPVPKVIDFGIAKATNGKLTDQTVVTEFRQVLGTPAYMSPEQAELTALDIDTRSDVYSLGVLLYELLTGLLPFDPTRLRSASLAELQRIIRDEEPPTPSSRISTLGPSATDVASRRRIDPKHLRRTLQGDLDWIVMKCLEKDRARRYETANGLATDIARHLAGEPVLAAPPGRTYRLRKFAWRNRVTVSAGAAVAAALLIGVVAFAWQASIAGHQRDRAVVAEGEATKRADELERVSDFQANMLAQVDPTEAGKLLTQDVTARFEEALVQAGLSEDERTHRAGSFRREWIRVNATDVARGLIDATILKPAVDAIDREFQDQPLVDAQLRQRLANRYRDLGLYDAAMPLQELALTTRRRVLGREHLDTLVSINGMGLLLYEQGKLAEAEPYFREALENRRRVLGEEFPDTLVSINAMGMLLQAQGKLAEAEPYYREALEKRRRVLGNEHTDTLTSINNLGFLLQTQGKFLKAEEYLREALTTRRRVLGEEHPHTLSSIGNMGMLLSAQGKRSEAEPYYRETLEKSRRVRGEEHPHTLTAIGNLGFLLQSQGKLHEAEPYYREALEKSRRVLGEEHPGTLTAINNMGVLAWEQGKLKEAEACFREALEKRRRVLGEEHADTLRSLDGMGSLLRARGRPDEAEPYFREALEKCRRVLGEEHADTLRSINNMGTLLRSQGKLSEAETYLREAVEKYRRAFGREHPNALTAMCNLGETLSTQGKLEEAEPLFREALEGQRRVLGEDHLSTLFTMNNLGFLLQSQGKLHEAEPYYREALEKRRRVLGEEHQSSLVSTINMGSLLVALGKYAEAVRLLDPIHGAARKVLTGANARRLALLLMYLGKSRANLGEFAAAETNLLEAQPIFIETPSGTHKDTRNCTQAIVDLYTAWHAAKPDMGYDAKAAEWRAKLAEWQASTQAAASQPAGAP